jgi:hypothetical protein
MISLIASRIPHRRIFLSIIGDGWWFLITSSCGDVLRLGTEERMFRVDKEEAREGTS